MQTIQKDSNSDNNSKAIDPYMQPQLIEVEPPSSTDTDQPRQYHQEWYRWVIIFLVAVAFAINNLANNAIIPISSKVSKIYDLSQTYANLPIQVSFLINPIMNFTAGSFIDSKGLGISFRIGAVLYAVGLLLFCLINYGYHWVLIGAILIALGQPLVMNCPAKIATFWFVDRNRTVATGIISAINLVTLGVSLVFPAIFVKQDAFGEEAKQQIFNLYSKYFIVAVINCLLIMFLMREKPERLPSAGAEQQKTTLSKTWQIIKSDRNIWKYFAASILLYGTFLSFGSTSNMLFKSYNFEDIQIAIFGVCLLVSGILGSIAYTIYIKKTIKYKNAIVCACTLAVVFQATNGLLMNLVPEQRVLISILILGMGFNLIPMVPISYDLGCELTFPVGEAQVVGIVTGGSMLYTVVLTLTISSVVGFGTAKQSAICMIIYITLTLIGAILYAMVDIKLKRRDHEQRALEGRKTLQGNDYEINMTMNDSAKQATLIRPLNERKISESQQMLTIQQDIVNNNSILTDTKSVSSGEVQDVDTGESSPQKFPSKEKKLLVQTLLDTKQMKVGSQKKKQNKLKAENQMRRDKFQQ